MYQLSSAFGELIQKSSRTFLQKIIIDGKTEITEGITQVKINGGSNSEDNFSIGSAVSQYIEAEISNLSEELEGHELQYLIGMNTGSSIEYVPMGYFTAEKPKRDEDKATVTAYDRMAKTDRAYFSKLPDKTTTTAVLNEISQFLGIPVNISGLSAISMDKPKGYTCREVFSIIAQMYGGFAICNRLGEIEIRTYQDQSYEIKNDRYWDSFTHSDFPYSLTKITCYTGKDEEGKSISLTAGTGAGGISISNPFMSQSVLNEVWAKIGNYTYMPGKVKFLGDPRIDPWDVLTVFDRDGNSYKVPSMKFIQTCDGGLTTEVESVGKTEAEEEDGGFKGPSAQLEERIYTELALINHAIINKLDAEEASITYATIANLNAINASIENLDTKFATIDLANIKNGCITTAMIGTGVIGTTQIADGSITDAKIIDLTANKLTSGTIDAASINVINLNCENLTVGQINGQQIAPGAVDTGNLSDGVIKMIEEGQSAADGNKIFYQDNAPSTEGRKSGDTWFDTDGGYKIYRFNGSSWVAAQLSGDALAVGAITSSHIAAGAINTDKLAANAVTGAKIAAGTITAANIASSTITGDKISSSTITATNLSSGCITADKIASRAITAAKIASSTITANEIAAYTITSAEIASGAITADKIAAGAVTAGKISVTDLSAIGATIGGFTIGSTRLYAGSSSYGYVAVQAGTSSTAGAFAAGMSSYSNFSDAKFRVRMDGKMFAEGAEISGTMKTVSGSQYAMLYGGAMCFGVGSTDYGMISTNGAANQMYIGSTKLILGGALYVAPEDGFSGSVAVEGPQYKSRTATLTISGTKLIFRSGILCTS